LEEGNNKLELHKNAWTSLRFILAENLKNSFKFQSRNYETSDKTSDTAIRKKQALVFPQDYIILQARRLVYS
jgi:hypothetical protein